MSYTLPYLYDAPSEIVLNTVNMVLLPLMLSQKFNRWILVISLSFYMENVDQSTSL